MSITRRAFIKSLALNSAVAAATLFPGISFAAWEKTDLDSGSIAMKKSPIKDIIPFIRDTIAWNLFGGLGYQIYLCLLVATMVLGVYAYLVQFNIGPLSFSPSSGPSASTWSPPFFTRDCRPGPSGTTL